ncbi:hypothetical protein Ancab_015749 [Ancistrocladus abbreviatus]
MVCMEAAAAGSILSLLPLYLPAPLSSKLHPWPKPSPFCNLHNSTTTFSLFLKFPLYPLPILSSCSSIKPKLQWRSTVEEVAEPAVTGEDSPEKTIQEEGEESNQRKKLYVVNLPWNFSALDIKTHFSQCGTVKHVEVIKNKDGKNRGFAFVTMDTGDEAGAVIDKFNSTELSGRTISVQYAKKFRPPRPGAPSDSASTGETRYKLYVSNLQWKVRSSHLREFFSAHFNPVSARIVFDSPSGRPAGYGFVSFATREEAEAAMSSLNGKDLLGRPVRLKFSEKKSEESGNLRDEKDTPDKLLDEHIEEQSVQQ